MRNQLKFVSMMLCFLGIQTVLGAQESGVYKVAEVMPRVKTCAKAENASEQRACMQKYFVNHFSENLKYPSEAKEAGKEGSVILKFIVRKDGSVDGLEVMEDPGFGMADAALKAFRKMKADWLPGSNFGEKVDVEMVLPVQFALPESEKPEAAAPSRPEPEVYMIADVMPRFAGCEDEDASKARTCTRDKSIAFITSNLKYPEEAKKAGVEGVVHAEFIVDSEGNVIEPKIVKGLNAACDAEVLRVLGEMPAWIPGEQGGKKVKVKQMMPFRFKLGEKAAEAAPVKPEKQEKEN